MPRPCLACGDVEGGPRRHREAGIAAARSMDLEYELALLLVQDDEAGARREGRALLAALGVETARRQRVARGSSMP